MKVLGKPKPEEWQGEVLCSNGARGGCSALLAVTAHDLYAEPHFEPDPREAVQGWYECSVVCAECGTRIFVPSVPKYVGAWAYRRRSGQP